MKLTHVFTLTSASLISAVAFAADLTFQTLDSNNDGVISPTEAQVSEELAKQYRDLDSNKDNELTPVEFAQFKK
ncbi:calmodulin [Pseudoalteromonas sp. T1lg23B]|uniref:calmodulin n=1 Tax=Pseudoalteromonas sp. T1lg23B TaxID=2077097 RepID=UPI000CF63AB5|nr:calmodulin [Pseudoalteromonas sp. T1lg23B]